MAIVRYTGRMRWFTDNHNKPAWLQQEVELINSGGIGVHPEVKYKWEDVPTVIGEGE